MRKQPDDAFQMTITSPPYPLKTQRYPGGPKMTIDEWVDWMASVVTECVRVSKGYVWFVINNPIRQFQYIPAIEMLSVKLYRDDNGIMLDRPDIWHKNAAPSRQGAYFSNDYEQVVCFKKQKQPLFNWEAVARPPVFKTGGDFRQRKVDGSRPKSGSAYPKGKLAKPRDVFRVTVGGGHTGFDKLDDSMASQGKAPYPLGVSDRFVQVGSDVGDIVFDPFAGSGTTGVSCLRLGRRFVGTELSKEEFRICKARLKRVKEMLA